MKQRTSWINRCIALALALVLLVSQANMGLVQHAHAAEYDVDTTVAKIIAANYDLTDAEKALLNSGYLISDPFTANNPSNEWVSVDTDKHTITAESKANWVPVKALIMVGNEEKETVALNGGKGTYTYAGNAFSVKVVYELSTKVSANVQNALLGVAAILKQGVANLDAVAGQTGNLAILEKAMPELVTLANTGVQTSFMLIELSDECKAAISALNGQMNANGGKLLLSSMIEELDAGTKTGYLMTKSGEMKAEIADLVAKVAIISEALSQIYANVEWLISGGYISATLANQIKTLAGVCQNLADGLAAVNADPWTTTDLVKADTDYAKLDALVAALNKTTAVTVKETLKVAEVAVQVNMAMFNVTYKVILNHVVNNEQVEGFRREKTETLAKGATAAEMQAFLSELEDKLQVEDYDLNKFERSITNIPETLTEDLEIVVTYNPKNFNVTIAGETKAYPYGWQLTLPVHEDPMKSYDYKDAKGKYYPQGSVVTVEDSMTFTREEGKAYTAKDLFTIIADNYGNEKVAAILVSGAVKGNEAISYREPSKAELEELVNLNGNTLTVQSYASSYAGLNWVPYSYVVDGAEKLFNGASKVVISGDFETVNVYYRLTMTNHTESEVREILNLVEKLADEAEGQKSVMDRLAGFGSQMGELNKNMMTGLNAVIGNYSSANDGGLNADPVKNDQLVAYFQNTIGAIIENCYEGQALKLYNIILGYQDTNNGGLVYYYKNDAAVRNELSVLSGYLNDMLDKGERQAALEKLMADNGQADKVDMLENLGTKLAEIEADLAPANAAIDTANAANLSKLAAALSAPGSAVTDKCGSPYVQMGPVIRTADKFVTVEIKVNANGKTNTDPISVTILKKETLSQTQINELKAKVNAFVNATIETAYFNNNYNNGADLDALVGKALIENATYEYTWTAKEYTVKIAGEADQIVSINNLRVTLPEHPNTANGMRYVYTIKGEKQNAGIFTFEKEDLLNLFKDGVLTITRVEKNEAEEKLENMVEKVPGLALGKDEGGNTVINAEIAASDMMGLMMGLVMDSGYGYIGLNDEPFVYNENNELKLSLQTMINAICNDESFSQQTLIDLAKNGGGKLFTTTMQLSDNNPNARNASVTNVPFTMYLKSVPQEMIDNAALIEQVSSFITFKGGNGTMDFEVNLPDQAYAVYAAALVATGHVDKHDINTMEKKVPMQFLYDYLTAITGSEMDLKTFTNTLEMMGFEKNLAKYNDYYNSALEHTNISMDGDKTKVEMFTPGKKSIDALVNLLKIDISAYESYLTMLREYDDSENVGIEITATARLKNPDKTYYALVLDAQADGVTNKIDAPTSVKALNDATSNLAGYSFVILTENVVGDLNVSGTTILDLNGFGVTGNINATGKVYIIDSALGNSKNVVGGVTGNASILAGNYGSDVTSKLLGGCYQENGIVRNALYKVEEDAEGNLTFILDGNFFNEMRVNNFMPDAKALAVNIATDVLMNYFMTAKVAIDGNDLVALDVPDLVGLYAGDNRIKNLAKNLLDDIFIGEESFDKNVGFEAVVNKIMADMLNFEAITAALENNTALATYELTTAPWMIEVEHKIDLDYATLNVKYNDACAKTRKISLVVDSKYNDNVSAMTGILADIVVADETFAEVDLTKPAFENKTLKIYGGAQASMVMDMSHNTDYATVIAVVLAYGNSAKRAAVADAINTEDMAALKAVIDSTTVAEIFTALKKLDRNTNYAAMAEVVGVKSTKSAAKIEGAFHLALCAAGKVLEELDITGMDSKLGGLYNEETGYYELTRENIFRDKEINVRSYSALVELSAPVLSLKVKLFGEQPECMWGDANHDDVVDEKDIVLVERYIAEYEVGEFCTIRTDVNADGEIDEKDAILIRQYVAELIEVFPAENK